MPIKVERYLCVIAFLLCAFGVSGVAAEPRQDSDSPAVARSDVYPDASSFAAELQRIGKAIVKEKANPSGLAAVRKNLPSHWEITAGKHHYSVSAEPLNGLLHEAEGGKNAKSIAAKASEAAEWSFDLASQAKGYAGAQTDGGASAGQALQRILNRREFGGVRPPSRWDLLRQRIIHEIESLLVRIFQSIGRHPIGAGIFFWSILAVVVVWLAVMLFRYWTRRGALEELQAPDSVAYVRTWQEWIQAARAAATRGDFREAVHSAYWAGISSLEDNQMVRKDRTRTPREYMRLVSSSTQLVATGRKTREALSALTVVLEQVWYGRRPANNQDFAQALQSVEALGCHLQ
jgi:hypothetical protein